VLPASIAGGTTLDLVDGQVVGHYVVVARVVDAPREATYRVRHLALGSSHLLRVVRASSPTAQRQLLAEGQRQSAIRHENLHRVTDAVEMGGAVALIYEDLEFIALEAWLEQSQTLPWELGVEVMVGVTRALGAVHRAGLVHRALDPSAVWIDVHSRPVAKVTGFRASTLAGDVGLDGVATMGRAGYAAPEQLRDGRQVDARADLFALGALFFLVLARRPAFDGAEDFAVHAAVKAGTHPSLAALRPDLPAEVVQVVHELLEPDVDARPASVPAVLARLAVAQRREQHRRLALAMWAFAAPALADGRNTRRFVDWALVASAVVALIVVVAVH